VFDPKKNPTGNSSGGVFSPRAFGPGVFIPWGIHPMRHFNPKEFIYLEGFILVESHGYFIQGVFSPGAFIPGIFILGVSFNMGFYP